MKIPDYEVASKVQPQLQAELMHPFELLLQIIPKMICPKCQSNIYMDYVFV